ncbi:MAG: alanine dehydrogenase, partial [Deltaproteobacteria bacterium]|nr:alanine dehydrogenase [Deltaproteobacteria bacterium]
LVTEELVKKMKKGSVIIDVSVDQGGCIETTRPTTHTEPTFILHDVIHYGVTNMPGSVPRTSTFALTNATLPYIQKMAENGTLEACLSTKELKNGINISGGKVTHPEVAESLGLTPGEL